MNSDLSNVSLLVTSQQVSNSASSTVLPDLTHTRAHRYIDLICVRCGHQFPVPVYCGFRFCRICSVRRQARVRRRLDFLISNVKFKRPYGLKHLTLTIPNISDLPKMVKKMISSFRRLRQRAYWKNHVNGGAFVIEITGNPGNWHAHIHAIIEAKYMDWTQLHKLWKACSGGQGLYISKISRRQAVNYLSKYLTKAGVSSECMEIMSDALRGTRLFSPFGLWYAFNLTFVPSINPCPACDDGDIVLFDLFTYGKWIGAYIRYD